MAWIDDAIKDLYSVPLSDFTKRRNELAGDLRVKGDKDHADRVRSLKRPTLAAWALNRLAREDAAVVAELAATVGRIAEGQSASELREAMEARRSLIADLAEHAQQILEQAGHNASVETMNHVVQTLAGATSGDDLERLVNGTLSRPLSSSGFERAISTSLPAPQSNTEERLRRELKEVNEQLTRRIDERFEAQRAVARAEGALRQAENNLRSTERHIARLEQELDDLKRRLRNVE
ncbi:MAG: hypothetical protein M3280_11765 [Actinomycetota bacterium]|nr:hypothetical protein [Actinomycetota bacterium]